MRLCMNVAQTARGVAVLRLSQTGDLFTILTTRGDASLLRSHIVRRRAQPSSATMRTRCGIRTLGASGASTSSTAMQNRSLHDPSVREKFVPRISIALGLHALPLIECKRDIDE